MKRSLLLTISLLSFIALCVCGSPISKRIQLSVNKKTDVAFNTAVPEIQKYRLQRVWIANFPLFLSDRPILVLIDPHGKIFEMPKQLEKLISSEDVSISTPQEALNLASTYVTLSAGYGKVMIIDNLKMIPDVETNPPKHTTHDMILPPAVQSNDSGYRVHIFSWKELGGVIEEWTIDISRSGYIKPSPTQIEEGIGNAIGLL